MHASTENEDGLLEHVLVCDVWLFCELQPRIRLEAHQSSRISKSRQEHDVAVGLLALAKQLLFDHLSVVDKADELPLSQVNDALRHVESHVHNHDLAVLRSPALVRQKWIVDDV